MAIKKAMIAACAAATLITGTAIAQPRWVPPGNDPDGYYSDADHNGYYDRDGRYRRIRDHREDRSYYGPPPPPPPAPAYGPPPPPPAPVRDCRRDNRTTGTILGAIAGGLIGGFASHG